MCLDNAKNKASNLKWKGSKGREYKDCYKVYCVDRNPDRLHPVIYSDRGTLCYESPGWIISDRENKGLDKEEKSYKVTYKGIHVFLDEKLAKAWKYSDNRDEVIVKVRCYKKDYISHFGKRAVFMKVYLNKSEWDKVFE